MAATISGVVFNDVNNNGVYAAGKPGIPGVYLVLYNQTTSTCISTITNASGNYSFSITIPGTYTIYETVSNSGTTCPPNNFTQPSGFTLSNGPRNIILTITSTQISSNSIISNNNFSHTTNVNIVPCSSNFIQFRGTPTQWININLVTGSYVIKGNLNPQIYINAIAINPLDNYIYGIDNSGKRVVRIDSNGNVMSLYPYPTGLGTNFNAAAFNPNGFLFLYSGSTISPQTKFYVLDVRPTSGTYLKLVNPANGYQEQTSNYGISLSASLSQIIDWGYNTKTNLLYGVNYNGIVQSVNPITGQVSNLTTTGVATSSQGFGAVIADNNGVIYALSNATGSVYRIIISGNVATGQYFSQSLASNANDGAFCINASLDIDFGDAPDTSSSTGTNNYNTLLSNNGPRHLIVENLYIGTTITAENDAYQNSMATGDDQSKGIQDDGVTMPLTLYTDAKTYSLPVTITNKRGTSANLYGWIDFNKDGVFQGSEAANVVIIPSSSLPQVATLTFNVPSTITSGYTFSRVRLTTENLINTNTSTLQDTRSIGPAQDGEVEDYYLNITIPSAGLNNLVKGNNKVQAIVGETITYTITIPNTGSSSVTNVNIYDKLAPDIQLIGTPTVSGASGGTGGNLTTLPGYNIGTIPAQSMAIFKFDVLVKSIPNPSIYMNTATVSYNGALGVTTVTVSGPSGGTPILNPANLSTSVKGNNKSQAIIGETIQYIITIPNTGQVPARNINVYDSLPEGIQIIGTPYVSGSSGGTGGNLTILPGYNIGTIQAGSTALLTFDVLVSSITNPSTYLNTATISYEDQLGIGTITVSGPSGGTPILNPANLSTSVKGNNKLQAVVGEVIKYTITIPNTGDIDAKSVSVYDSLTQGLQVIGTPTVSGATGGSGGELTISPGYNIGTISTGNIAVLTFNVLVSSMPNPSTYLNIATISYKDNVKSNTVTVNGPVGGTKILYPADISSTIKGCDKEQALVGQTLQYTITIPNTGEVPATNVNVYDNLAPGLQIFGTPTVSGASGGLGGNLSTLPGYNVGTILNGSTATLIFDVLIVSLPNSNKYINSAKISYEDQLGTSIFTVTGPTNGTIISDNHCFYISNRIREY